MPIELNPQQKEIATQVIKLLAGPDATLRDDQTTAIASLCTPGARVLVVQATGWGKSAVYWAATSIIRAANHGPSLVISPLLSLMRDQVSAAQKAGLRAITLNSSNSETWPELEDEITHNRVDVILVSPERLANPAFSKRVLAALAKDIGLLVIDEAHSISDWGHDFRPDYQRIAKILSTLEPTTPILATTATANQRVTSDIAKQLGSSTLVMRGPLARKSLQLAVIDDLSPIERYAWVADHLPILPGSGIIYVLTVSDAIALCDSIRAVHKDTIQIEAYHGQMPSSEREVIEDDLRNNRLKAVVATSALGMGYDKADLSFVINVGSPSSPVSYYQQIGRAGRAIEHALVVLLPSKSDERLWEYFATSNLPKGDQIEKLLKALEESPNQESMTIPALEAETGIRRSMVELLLKQMNVAEAVERSEKGWRSTNKGYDFDQSHIDEIISARRRESAIMKAYARQERCLMQLLQESLDDPEAKACNRCSVCIKKLPEPLSMEVSPEAISIITQFLRRQTLILEPRKMWPGGVFGKRGRIPSHLLPEAGRTLIFADSPQWQEILTEAFGIDQGPSETLCKLAIDTMVEWKSSWRSRPQIAASLPAGGYPALTDGLADHIARVGKLERFQFNQLVIPKLSPDASSSQEAALWQGEIQLTLEEKTSLTGKSVLLVIDATSSIWPITIAAAKILEAGATMVLPMLIHRRA